MIEICPVIHGGCAKLQFDFDPLAFILEWHSDLKNQMQTLIAGFLWLFDIVLCLDDTDILLFLDQFRDFINIIYIRTNGTHADQVIDFFQRLSEVQIQFFFLHFFALS